MLLSAGVICYRALVLSNRSQGWVRHTDQVCENLQELLFATQNIESSSRGVLLTGDKPFIQTFQANIALEAQAEGSIGMLAADNAAQQRRMPALKKLLAQKIRFSEIAIDLPRAKGLEAGVTLIGDGAGQQIMDEIQDLVLKMQNEERRLLAERDAGATRQSDRTKICISARKYRGLVSCSRRGVECAE